MSGLLIKRLAEPIEQELTKVNIPAEIVGRPKQLYSIYRKIHIRNVPFEKIYDLFALRILVNRVDECYFALGIVHTFFTPVHERFKDYIATPELMVHKADIQSLTKDFLRNHSLSSWYYLHPVLLKQIGRQ